MFTRCPECQAVYRIHAEQLAQAGGVVTCDRCQKVFNALTQLFNELPGPDISPVKPAAPGMPADLQNELTGETTQQYQTPTVTLKRPTLEADRQTKTEAQPITTTSNRSLWVSLAILMTLVTTINIGWSLRDKLLDQPAIKALAERAGWVQAPREQPQLVTDQFFLVSRDMHPHPGLDGALILSATFVNRADFRQPYPVLEITLFDTSQQALARRRFQPREYLDPAADPKAGLAPNILLPIVLELQDPGPHAVGFEIQFL